MKNEFLKEAAKKVLSPKQYYSLRARLIFNLHSPFPIDVLQEFDPKWNEYLRMNRKTRMAYIVSPAQRSGTNFIHHMMSLHPKLVTPDFGDYPNEHCLYSYSDEIKKYAYQTVLAWSKWTKEGKYSVDEQTKKLTATIGDGIINYFTDELNADELLLFKTPDSGNIQDFFHLFPSEKVILLIRDGRDTVESFLKSWGGTALFKKMTIRWKNRMNQIERFMEQSKQSGFMDQLLLVNYEDLNATPEKELTKIFDFIDLDKKLYPWDDLEKIPILGSSTYRGDEAKVNWKPVEKKSDFNPSKKWENWSARKKRTFKKIAGDELINFGFAKDQRW